MLSPIPGRILSDTMTLTVPTAFDGYQKPTGSDTYIIHHVHMQSENRTAKNADNSEVRFTGTIFVDARKSLPALDFESLQEAAQAAGGVMACVITSKSGRTSKQLTILTVDALPDDEGNLHHYELGVV